MNEFKGFHPFINFIYFLFVIGFSMVFMHPVCIAVSFVSSIAYATLLIGKKSARFNFLYMPLLILAGAIINPILSKNGLTVVSYLPFIGKITLEAICYGAASAGIIAAVIIWFSCFNKIMTGDKLVYLFGKLAPSLSLVFTMVLRFVPKFKAQLKKVSNAQKSLQSEDESSSFLQRVKNAIKILSIMITWCLEDAVETADSMKSRGYGLKGRTAFSSYVFSPRDFWAIAFVLLLSAFVITGVSLDFIKFAYFPYLSFGFNIYGAAVFCVYLLLCMFPIFVEVWGCLRWKLSKQKI